MTISQRRDSSTRMLRHSGKLSVWKYTDNLCSVLYFFRSIAALFLDSCPILGLVVDFDSY
jgi:hypothetical protein